LGAKVNCLASRIQMIGNGGRIPISRIPPISSFEITPEVILEQHARRDGAEYGEFKPTTHLIFVYDGAPVNMEGWFGGMRRHERVHPGQVWIVPRHLTHYCAFGGPHAGVLLSIGHTVLERHTHVLSVGQLSELAPQINIEDAQLRYTLLGLLAVVKEQATPTALLADLLIQAVCIRTLTHYGRPGLSLPKLRGSLPAASLRRVLDYINSNLGKNLRLSELATICDTSLYHFVTLFKQSTGTTPYQYVLRRRIERAQKMLVERQPSILEVSLSLGFEHPNNFARTFRRLTGVTPKQFRRDNLLAKST
jgi:AraC family transcriptional regulator